MKNWSKKLLILVFLFILIFTFLTGAYSYKFGYIGIARNIFSIVPNFVSGQITKLNLKNKKLNILIEKKDFEKINSERKKIINFNKTNAITETFDDKNQFVKVKLNYKNKIINSYLTLGGLQHGLNNEKKWPFRIKTDGVETLLGVNKFVLYHPKNRNYIFEWIFHKTFKKENGISLFYDFIPVALNGDYLGIYALEESFGKKMLKNNNQENGPILKLDMSLARNTLQMNEGEFYELQILKDPLITFWQEKDSYKDDEEFKKNFVLAAKNLDGFRKGRFKTSEIFNLKKLATYVALCDLFQGQHALYDNNLIFYFNPETLLLEPISFETNSADSVFDLSIQISQSKGENLTLKRIFEDKKFNEEYISRLKYFSKKEFLDNLLSDLDLEIKKKIKILNSEFYSISNKTDILYKQQKFIQANINPLKGIRVFYNDKNNNNLSFHIGNIQAFPVQILSLMYNDTEISLDDNILIAGVNGKEFTSYEKINFEVPSNIQISNNSNLNNYKIKYKILGFNEIKYENAIHENYIK